MPTPDKLLNPCLEQYAPVSPDQFFCLSLQLLSRILNFLLPFVISIFCGHIGNAELAGYALASAVLYLLLWRLVVFTCCHEKENHCHNSFYLLNYFYCSCSVVVCVCVFFGMMVVRLYALVSVSYRGGLQSLESDAVLMLTLCTFKETLTLYVKRVKEKTCTSAPAMSHGVQTWKRTKMVQLLCNCTNRGNLEASTDSGTPKRGEAM